MKLVGKIHWTWKKIVTTVLTLLGIGTLTSCYGMPYNCGIISGQVLSDKDLDGDGEYNDGIEGIKAELFIGGRSYRKDETWEGGRFYFEIGNGEKVKGKIVFTDVDGEENGSYESQELEVELNGTDTYKTGIKVTLKSTDED